MRTISGLRGLLVLAALLAGCPEFTAPPPPPSNANDHTPPSFSNFSASLPVVAKG